MAAMRDARHLRSPFGDHREGLAPLHLMQLAVAPDIRPVEPVALQAVDGEARLVGNPLLVHVFMEARQDAQHGAAA